MGCIFLPATGFRGDDGEGYGRGLYGSYWTTSSGSMLYVDPNPYSVGFQDFYLGNGLAVRCVKIQ